MAKDEIDENKGRLVLVKIDGDCRSVDRLAYLPMQIGLFIAMASAILSVPFVFKLSWAVWFDKNFVTMEIPKAEDVDTILEVGAWTWNWMEPPLGVASFVLLCLQFARGQMVNMRWAPYTQRMLRMRADRAAQMYPKYNAKFVKDFALIE